ncbi:hypothetical protein NQZ79_g6265 [Umbelopsis isabellina]|nr:hypothetical protein NQZ79_g6265 [Umbelopsis isabellina]
MSDKDPSHSNASTDYHSQIPAFDNVWQVVGETTAVEQEFRKILEQSTLTSDTRAEALTQLARCQGLQAQFDDAKETLRVALGTSNAPIPHIRYLLEFGRVLRSSGHGKESIPYFAEAYHKAIGLEDYYAADAAHMLAILDPKSGPNESKTWSQEALDIARKSDNVPTQRWAAIILNNTAWDAFDEGSYQKALDLFIEATALRKRALEAHENSTTKQSYRIARWSEAYTLRYMEQYEKAYKIQNELLSEGETKPNRQELAILADKLGHIHEAEKHRQVLESKFK